MIDGPNVPIEELISLVRHSKLAQIKDALDYLPNKKFDKSLVQVRCHCGDTGGVSGDNVSWCVLGLCLPGWTICDLDITLSKDTNSDILSPITFTFIVSTVCVNAVSGVC
jgi:hypothetical protein